ncbi:CGG triplet repeat-binding protein 1, partial [Aphis craccivora]
MPKVKTNSFLKKLVLEFGEEFFQTDGSFLYCKLCETKVSHEKKYNIQHYIRREKHVQAVKRHENEKAALLQPFLQQLMPIYVQPKIRDTITDQKIWVSIDETTDSVRRNVANVIVGTLQPKNPSNMFVIHTEYLDKVVKHNDVLLFVSDAPPYMKKAGDCIKSLYPKLIHVTSLTHALHNVFEDVRAQYQDKCPELPNPPRPIMTRWGTWIKAVHVIEDFEEESQCVKVVKQLFQNVSLQSNIVYISTNFGFIPDMITILERKGESLTTCINIILDAEKKLNEANGDIATAIS